MKPPESSTHYTIFILQVQELNVILSFVLNYFLLNSYMQGIDSLW